MSGRTVWGSCGGCDVIGGARQSQACGSRNSAEWSPTGREKGCDFLGCKYQCKHVNYTGDASKCCLGQSPGSGRTCDPVYNSVSNQECQQYLHSHCANNMNVAKCKSWLATKGYGDGGVKNALKTYCTSDDRVRDDPICRNWLSHPDGWGMHDPVMTGTEEGLVGYCDKPENKDDPLCSCINSPLGGLAACWDENCINPDSIGYETGAMIKLNDCGSYCNQEIRVSGEWNADDVIFYGCPQNETPPISDARSNPIDVGDNSNNNSEDGLTNQQMILVVFLFILWVVIGAIILKLMRRKWRPSPQQRI
jgi:hypothetical protein